MMVACEQEADAKFVQRLLRHRPGAVHVETERFQRIGRTGLGRGGAVTVLGHGHAAGRHDDCYRGGDVQRVVSVTAGAAHVDRSGRRGDWDQPLAERPGCLGNLDRCLAALRQGDKERGNIVVARAAVEDVGERLTGTLARERRAGIGEDGEKGHCAALFRRARRKSRTLAAVTDEGRDRTG